MSILRFSDGVTLNMGGKLRIECHSDGWYVLGNGMSIPVKNRVEGQKMIANMEANSAVHKLNKLNKPE